MRAGLTGVLMCAMIGCGSPAAAQNRPGLAYQLTHSVTVDPSFSPDGRMVYITVVAGKEQLFVSRIDGRDPVQITHDAADHEDPAWSPDGRKIAYVSMANGERRIYLMNPDGTGVEALTPPDRKVIHPNWTPDGKGVTYCTDDDLQPPAKNTSEIQTIDIASRKITTQMTGGINTYPSWSPDGKRFAFRKIIGDMNSEVFIADANGGNIKNLSNHWSFDGWPAWSPDG
ncbi:MAG: LpqB family beta-propeller domain-containing protein [Caulobacteraceae bacterium]